MDTTEDIFDSVRRQVTEDQIKDLDTEVILQIKHNVEREMTEWLNDLVGPSETVTDLMTLEDLIGLYRGKTFRFGLCLLQDPELEEEVPEDLQELAQRYNTDESQHQFMTQLLQQLSSIQVVQSLVEHLSSITPESLKEDPVGDMIKFSVIFSMNRLNKRLAHRHCGCC